MRPIVAAILAVLIAPAAAGQIGWTDPAGDQTVEFRASSRGAIPHTQAPNPADWYSAFDLLQAGVIAETADTLTVAIEPRSFTTGFPNPELIQTVAYWAFFSFHGEERALLLQWTAVPDRADASIMHATSDGWERSAPATAARSEDGLQWHITFDKWDLRDSMSRPPRDGDVLADWSFRVQRDPRDDSILLLACGNIEPAGSITWLENGCGFYPWDELAPDGSGDHVVTGSPRGIGHLVLETDAPLRASNGLATTYLYNLTVHNLGSSPDTITLEARDVPAGWQVFMPKRLVLEPDERRPVPVAVSVPFRHVHGETASVTLVASSQQVPGVAAQAKLSVEWTEVPQPGGHHPDVYLHGTRGATWMNTRNEDARTEQYPQAHAARYSGSLLRVQGNGDASVAEESTMWRFPLSPGLLMGLDFESGGSVRGELPVTYPYDASIEAGTARLIWSAHDMDPVIVARQDLSPIEFTTDTTAWLPIDMPVTSEGDMLPYHAGATLVFELVLNGTSNSWLYNGEVIADAAVALATESPQPNSAPWIEAGSSLRLPLDDYHDVIDAGLLSALQRLQVDVDGVADRTGNPGDGIAFRLRLTSDEQDTVRWAIQSSFPEWARVVPTAVTVGPGAVAESVVLVDIPDDAPIGQGVEFLAIGQSTRDEEAQVFARFLVRVVEDEVPDDRAQFAQLTQEAARNDAEAAPGPGLLLVVAGFALAWRRRTNHPTKND